MKNLLKFNFVILSFYFISFSVQGREWTVLVYMAADNDLARQSYDDILEMEEVGSSDEVAIVVQQDTPQEGGKRYLIEKGRRKLLQSLGTIAMGDPEVLSEFGRWGITNFPSQHILLILWDHGSGWTSGPSFNAFGVDWSSGTVMGVANGELRKAVLGIERKIDVLLFDGCTMQEGEVLSEMKELVSYMVSSQSLVPLDGMPYTDIFSFLVMKKSEISPRELSKQIVNLYLDSYNGGSQGGPLDVTLSSFDMSRFNEFINSLNEFNNKLSSNANFVKKVRDSVLVYVPFDNIDIGDFVFLIQKNSTGEVLKAASYFLEVLRSAMVANGFVGNQYCRATGVSGWFPKDISVFLSLLSEYKNLNWVRLSNWDEMVFASYGVLDVFPPFNPILSSLISVGEDNDFILEWTKAYDPSGLGGYELRELEERYEILRDDGEGGWNQWVGNGFIITDGEARSGKRSFFSKTQGTLRISLPINIFGTGWLSFYSKRFGGVLFVEISVDSLFTQPVVLDSIWGYKVEWEERGLNIPKGQFYLRLRTQNTEGIYIDDILIEHFLKEKKIFKTFSDTLFRIVRKPKGTYYYQVRAVDLNGNWSSYSPTVFVDVINFAKPYNTPNPFLKGTDITFDYSYSGEISVFIYTISGELVRRIVKSIFSSPSTLYWDGRNEAGEEVAGGIYLYLIRNRDLILGRGKMVKIR